MPEKTTYLVRDQKGHMRSVIAQSHRGAMEIFVERYSTTPGDTVEIKRRGYDAADWQSFRVTR